MVVKKKTKKQVSRAPHRRSLRALAVAASRKKDFFFVAFFLLCGSVPTRLPLPSNSV